MIGIKDYMRYVVNRLRCNKNCYVVADCSDNSVTFSDALYRQIDPLIVDADNVMTFYVPRHRNYGFIINPAGINAEETAMSHVQLNTKYGCVGYEMLVPSVNRLFYDYKIAANVTKVKLSVGLRCNIRTGIVYYEIIRPR